MNKEAEEYPPEEYQNACALLERLESQHALECHGTFTPFENFFAMKWALMKSMLGPKVVTLEEYELKVQELKSDSPDGSCRVESDKP